MSTYTAGQDPSPEAELIREIERARLRALLEGDIETAGRLHAAEFQLVTPIGMALSKNDYLAAIDQISRHKVALWHTDSYEHRDGQWMGVWSQATAISPTS
jgi:hypothetical protein